MHIIQIIEGIRCLLHAPCLCHLQVYLCLVEIATKHVQHAQVAVCPRVGAPWLQVLVGELQVATHQRHASRIDVRLGIVGEEACHQVYDVVILAAAHLKALGGGKHVVERYGVGIIVHGAYTAACLALQGNEVLDALHIREYVILHIAVGAAVAQDLDLILPALYHRHGLDHVEHGILQLHLALAHQRRDAVPVLWHPSHGEAVAAQDAIVHQKLLQLQGALRGAGLVGLVVALGRAIAHHLQVANHGAWHIEVALQLAIDVGIDCLIKLAGAHLAYHPLIIERYHAAHGDTAAHCLRRIQEMDPLAASRRAPQAAALALGVIIAAACHALYVDGAKHLVLIHLRTLAPAPLLTLHIEGGGAHPVAIGDGGVIDKVASAMAPVRGYHGDALAQALVEGGAATLILAPLRAVDHHRGERLHVLATLEHGGEIECLAGVQDVIVVAYSELYAKQLTLEAKLLAVDVELTLVGALRKEAHAHGETQQGS